MTEAEEVTEVATSLVAAYRAKLTATGAYPSGVGLSRFIDNALNPTESYNFIDKVKIQADRICWPHLCEPVPNL
jgi:hypothetical protein